MTASDEQNRGRSQWLLPIDPAAHATHLPDDWRTCHDATRVWEAIARSQPIERWCLRSGYRTMRAGDIVWAYLSKRQEVCARGVVRAVVAEPAAPVESDGGSGDDGARAHPRSDADVGAPGRVASTGDAGAAPSRGTAAWFVEIDWDVAATAALCREPLPRSVFAQVPMSTCRANDRTVAALSAHLECLARQ